MEASKLFTPVTFGPLTLRNRTIRSAAFESMCPGNAPSPMLLDYHRSVAAGGIGMTTVAYAAVTQSGLSFDRQLWMRPEIVPGLKELTDAVHAQGAAAAIQLGHCGNMSHKSICGVTPVGASSGFNLYSPTFVRGLKKEELPEMARAYARSVNLAREAGFDAVEIHAGHGYLISQFLSPYTNRRKDHFGGTLQNRMRFMDMVMEEVMKAAGRDMAVLVKMNMRDGFRGGMEMDETLQVAKRLEQSGAHALVLSGGFVSKAPMYVMRGQMPIRSMTHYMDCWWLKYGVRMVGRWMIPSVPFREAYFLEDALKFRAEIKMPLVYVGGLVSREKIDEVLDDGFEAVQMARALLNEPAFVNRMRQEENARCNCTHSNYCIARMYSIEMACHQHLQEELPEGLKRELSLSPDPSPVGRGVDSTGLQSFTEHSAPLPTGEGSGERLSFTEHSAPLPTGEGSGERLEGLFLITGADGGMGIEITRALASAGYRVIMACRNPRLAEDKRQQLIRETGNASIEIMPIDLASLSSVSSFADTLLQRGEPISLLMNNAGTMETRRTLTEDGLERTVSVNYVGPYLLTRKLLLLMNRGSRIVNMVSCTYAIGKLDFPDFFLHGRKGAFWRIPIYSNTKLALTLFTLALAEKLKERGIVVNAADPGIVSTGIITMRMWFDPLTDIFFRPFIRTPRQGAATAISLLLDEEAGQRTGTLNASCRPKPLSDKYLRHPQMQELWDKTEQLLEKWL